MSDFFREVYEGWAKAPISGTSIALCMIGALISAFQNDYHGVLLWLISGNVIDMKRNMT